jgi:TRAP-type C4-dicarboxylate transport system permease small subunit
MRKLVDKILETFLVILLAALVIDVVWQVFSRYILNSPSSFTDELARILLIWVGILGAAWATGKKMHLAIDFFIDKFNKTNRKLVNKLINITVALFAFFVMIVGGGNLIYMLLKLGNTTAALSLPIGFVYAVIPLSGLLIVFYSLYHIFEDKDEEQKEIISID